MRSSRITNLDYYLVVYIGCVYILHMHSFISYEVRLKEWRGAPDRLVTAAVGFFFTNSELALKLWTVISGI